MRRYVSSPILTMTYYLRAVLLHVLPPRSGRAAGRVGGADGVVSRGHRVYSVYEFSQYTYEVFRAQ